MCLVTKQKTPETTKKDLVVYKIVKTYDNEKTVSSPHYSCRWEPMIIKQIDLSYERNKRWDNCEKFDGDVSSSYSLEEKEGTFTEVSIGLHAATTKTRLKSKYYMVRRFLIPAGSLVFRDKSGLIVSNKMMYYPYKKKTK